MEQPHQCAGTSINFAQITFEKGQLNIHYMVVTCHFVDVDFKLHRCILNFVDVPPPYSSVCIYNCHFKCMKERKTETKVASLTVDNARTNEVAAEKLKENLNLQKKIPLGEKMFHVRCLHIGIGDRAIEIQGHVDRCEFWGGERRMMEMGLWRLR
ncbi:hypothetical protein E3N88_43777 [Mikania micrantha]|uniref:Uncharacterized protein n=1 Tax=Mikania micrantha TaxID=192012 RepID=A0A5N6LEG5_9ASTR|nr:hypothetical protein E3N88_43777 [Mikania micrantha]